LPGGPTGLADWIAEERERLLVRERFEAHAREWVAGGAPPLAVDSGHLYRRYLRAGSTDPDALRFLAAAKRKRGLLRVLASALVLLGLFAAQRWWRGVELERFDAELQFRLEQLRNWRDPLRPQVVDGKFLAADLGGFEALARALSKQEIERVSAHRSRLQAVEHPTPKNAFTILTAKALEAEAERVASLLDDAGASTTPLLPAGRENLRRLRQWPCTRVECRSQPLGF
jgi:hypothetical protein